MEAFQKALPAGAMNFVSGRGRDTMPVLMETGKVDALAFIGGSGAADSLIKQHPYPHRLKIFLQLEAKNMGIFLPDIFQKGSDKVEELSKAVDQSVLGGESFQIVLYFCSITVTATNNFIFHSFEFQWTALYFSKTLFHSKRLWRQVCQPDGRAHRQHAHWSTVANMGG